MKMDIPTILADPTFRLTLIYLPNFLWFFAGFVQFTLRAHRFRGALSATARQQRTPYKIGDLWTQDIVVYLGAFGGALALSVVDVAYRDFTAAAATRETVMELTTTTTMTEMMILKLCLRVWGFAHASQGLVGWVRIRPSGRWDWERYLGPITYTDTVLCLWDLTLAFWRS